jgi:hypothetical protein
VRTKHERHELRADRADDDRSEKEASISTGDVHRIQGERDAEDAWAQKLPPEPAARTGRDETIGNGPAKQLPAGPQENVAGAERER